MELEKDNLNIMMLELRGVKNKFSLIFTMAYRKDMIEKIKKITLDNNICHK